jgi:8-oxo-dGTP pyrophosphatase MutT (NUDIX family)
VEDPQRTMIVLDQGGARFNYRIVGVAIDGVRVLLHRAEQDDFWILPGGRAELLEPATTTLRREMAEELGVAGEVGRLLWHKPCYWQQQQRSAHYCHKKVQAGCFRGLMVRSRG